MFMAFPLERSALLFSMVSIANAITASQYGRISQYFDARQLIALGFVGFGVSLLGVWAASTPLLIGAMLLCFGLGFGLVMPSLDTTVVSLVSGQLRASMMGVLTSMLWLGQTVGPIAFTGFAGAAFDEPVTGYRFCCCSGDGYAHRRCTHVSSSQSPIVTKRLHGLPCSVMVPSTR